MASKFEIRKAKFEIRKSKIENGCSASALLMLAA